MGNDIIKEISGLSRRPSDRRKLDKLENSFKKQSSQRYNVLETITLTDDVDAKSYENALYVTPRYEKGAGWWPQADTIYKPKGYWELSSEKIDTKQKQCFKIFESSDDYRVSQEIYHENAKEQATKFHLTQNNGAEEQAIQRVQKFDKLEPYWVYCNTLQANWTNVQQGLKY